MKKLFLSLCFIGLSTFAFANNNNNENTLAKTTMQEILVDDQCDVTITLYDDVNDRIYVAQGSAETCDKALEEAFEGIISML